jgi:hypothetical protein
MADGRAPYPVRVDAAVEPAGSRGRRRITWPLRIPHYVVLAFLCTAFVVVSVIGFVAMSRRRAARRRRPAADDENVLVGAGTPAAALTATAPAG